MAATAYFTDSFLDDVMRGNITVSSDTFYMMLLAPGSTPSKSSWAKRSDVSTEVTGTGYTAGGQAVTVTLTAASGNSDLELVNLADVSWAASTLSAAYAVVYKHRGGAASADNLVCIIDFGGTYTDTNGTFLIHMTTQLGWQN